jgi:hypothetical protein
MILAHRPQTCGVVRRPLRIRVGGNIWQRQTRQAAEPHEGSQIQRILIKADPDNAPAGLFG